MHERVRSIHALTHTAIEAYFVPSAIRYNKLNRTGFEISAENYCFVSSYRKRFFAVQSLLACAVDDVGSSYTDYRDSCVLVGNPRPPNSKLLNLLASLLVILATGGPMSCASW